MLNDDVEKYKREGRQQAFAEVLAWARTAKELFGKNASPVTRETVVQLLGGLEGFARDEATEQVVPGELLAEEVRLNVTGRAGDLKYGVIVHMRSAVVGSFVSCADEDQATELAVLLSTARRRR